MEVIHDLSQREFLGPLALVPTMGALHEGHASLIKRAREFSPEVIVSIFVNPLQFNDSSDLQTYPRTPENDVEIARGAGASILWIPEEGDIYQGEIQQIDPGPVGALYEGASRSGHFEGVLTVVRRLFDLVEPTWAFFGEKDFQQLFLIKEMVASQGLNIEILSVPTVRESDGLAISSRNVRLSGKDRQSALVISQALINASGKSSIGEMQEELDSTLAKVPEFQCEYAVIIDEEDFSLAIDSTPAKRALIAGWINGVRLIDNMPMGDTSK